MVESHLGNADSTRTGVWPALDYENLRWDARLTASALAVTRADRHRLHGTYRAAIPPRIAHLTYASPPELTAEVEEATVEIARYDSEMTNSPAPLDALLLRTEAAASSQIENLTASARSVALAELGDHSKQNATLIVANTRAMRSAIELARDLSTESVLAMHHVLLEEAEPETAGRWRSEPVWIGTSSVSPIGADFVAPRHGLVGPAMEDLMLFANRTNQPVLAQAAIAHAQFETIHPFSDGNGRTGRALLHAMLRHHRLSRHVTVPVSAGLLHDISAYHEALTAYRAGDPGPMVGRLAEAALRAVNNGRQLAADIDGIRDDWQRRVRARRDSAVWQVADLFLGRPVLNAMEVARELGAQPSNMHRHLEVLTSAGVLTRFNLYQRGLAWRADAVLAAMDDFARRAGRRRQI